MQIIEAEVLSLRDQAIAQCQTPQQTGLSRFFGQNKNNNSQAIQGAIASLLGIHRYFAGNIFNAESEIKQTLINTLIAGNFRQQMTEVFYLTTAQTSGDTKSKLIELQKILGVRNGVLNYKKSS